MKKLISSISFILVTAMVLTFLPTIGFAVPTGNKILDSGVLMFIGNSKCYVNAEQKQIDPDNSFVAPYLKNGRTFVPLRFCSEAFGCEVEWKADESTAYIKKGEITLSLKTGSDVINISEKDGKNAKEIKMDVSSEISENRVFVPVRFVAEALGKQAFYDRGLVVIANDAEKLNAAKDKDAITAVISAFSGLNFVGTKEKLYNLIGYNPNEFKINGIWDEKNTGDILEDGVDYEMEYNVVAAQSEDSGMGMGESDDFSQTNVQVAGVDEADIIKTDGKYVYYSHNGAIEIVEINEDGSLKHLSSFKVEDDFNFSEIYVDGDKIITIGSSYETFVYDSATDYKRGGYRTKAVVIDIKDRTSPKFERTVKVEGDYLSSRKIGSSVYFIANTWAHQWFDFTPYCEDNGKKIENGYDMLGYFPNIADDNITTIVGFNIDKPQNTATVQNFLGCGEIVYMSDKNLYLANTDYNGSGYKTNIYKFAVDNGEIVFTNSGVVQGQPLNQFSLDENKGFLRIATHTVEYGNKFYESNNLFVLDSMLNITGEITDIAPGERIYSTRFMGSRAYMVTFKQTDPLFAFDLEDPYNPEIMGALKIPGYSEYLHPYDENHLIGFGRDTTTDKYGNVNVLGVKIALFDVSDMTNPIEMFNEIIGGRGTSSPLLYDHKALLFSKERELLAFPITVYSNNSADGWYGEFEFDGAYVYNINLKTGFELGGKLTHLSQEDYLKSSSYGADQSKYIERLLYSGNNLISASNSYMMSNDIKTLKQKGAVEFK